MAVNIFDVSPVREAEFTVFLNTGTILDLALGKFYQGKNSYLCNGGLGTITGCVGMTQTYKSGIIDALISKCMSIYPDSQCYSYDSEITKPTKLRYDDFADKPISDRIKLINADEYDINEVHELIVDIVKQKEKHAKDLLVETPFLNPKTRKPISIILPTFFGIDSLSRARSKSEDALFEKHSLDDSKTNTAFLTDGRIKTHFMRQLVNYGRKAGIYFLITAHVDKKKEIGTMPWQQSGKDLQFMKSNQEMKYVGSQFKFLTTCCMQTSSVKAITTKEGECYYPAEHSTNTEINEIKTTIVRNKNNASGPIVPFMFSQYQGILNGLTNLNYIREYCDDKGLIVKGNGSSIASGFLPDTTFSRKTIREKLSNSYELNRALELSSQLLYIQNCWSSLNQSVDTTIPIDKYIDTLMGNKTPMISDILNSRGYWTYDKNEKRPLFTIFDTLQMIETGKAPTK